MKRLLAFSTISHAGIMLAGLALLSARGFGGMLLYLFGHALVKGALFMIAGILLAVLGGIDEIGLRGRGKGIKPVGAALALAGILLGGAPLGLLDSGADLLDTAATDAHARWLAFPLILGTACTGAAVLRVAGRVFLGWGKAEGEEEHAPTEQESEKNDRPLWLMMLPVSVLLLLAIVLGRHGASDFALRSAAHFIAWDGGASLGHLKPPSLPAPKPPPHPFVPWLTVGLSVLIAAHDLARAHLPTAWLKASDALVNPVLIVVDRLHNGLIGDYVAWLVVGLAAFSIALFIWSG